MARDGYDDYEAFRRAGSAGDYARLHGLDQLPWAKKTDGASRPTTLSGRVRRSTNWSRRSPSQVPTMWIQGLWDQEDMWGAIHCYLALKAKGQADHNYPRDGPVAAQPGQLRRLQSGPVEVGRRHGPAVPARCVEAVFRSVPEDWRAESRYAARVHLQHRGEPLGPPEKLAAGL